MKVPETILVALAADDAMDDAWREACLIAKTVGAEIVLAHAIPEAEPGSPDYLDVAARIDALLGELSDQAGREGVRVRDARLVRPGQPSDVVLVAAAETEADLIVLGAGAKGTLERLFVGSTAEEVMRAATAPVWVVRPGKAHQDLDHILCAVDDSQPAREALAAAIFLARTFVARLTLLTVVPADTGAALAPDQRAVRTCIDEFDLHGIELTTRIAEGEPAEGILSAARASTPDLLVLGSAGRTGIARLWHGNTAEKVVRQLPCSALTVKPPKSAE